MKTEDNFYTFTADTGAALLRQVAQRVLVLCRTPEEDFYVFERAPGLLCSGRYDAYRTRLLTFQQVPGFSLDAYAAWVAAPSLAEWRTLGKLLRAPQKTVTVHLALNRVPHAELPKKWRRAWRTNEKKRLDPQKPYPLPRSTQDWSPQVREQHTRREAYWWRTICIAQRTHTVDDVVFLLALVLLQEQMLQEPDVTSLRTTMTDYLRTAGGKGCADGGTAYLVLDRLLRQFIEPEHKDGLRQYINSFLRWTRHTQSAGAHIEHSPLYTLRHAETEGHGVTIANARTRFVHEGLPATRSTLHRWAQEWALTHPHLAFDDKQEQRRFTHEGIAEARLLLVCKVLTRLQTRLGKQRETARRFTARHKAGIREALQRGDTLESIASALCHPRGEDVNK
jgi:hypothetical protein